jgi:hypothetical protein
MFQKHFSHPSQGTVWEVGGTILTPLTLQCFFCVGLGKGYGVFTQLAIAPLEKEFGARP